MIWHRNGFWLLYKRLEKQRFQWPDWFTDDALCFTQEQLDHLIDGYNLNGMHPHRALTFAHSVYSTLIQGIITAHGRASQQLTDRPRCVNSAIKKQQLLVEKQLAHSQQRNEQLQKSVQSKTLAIEKLEERLRVLLNRQFGKKSERLNPDQFNLFNEAELTAEEPLEDEPGASQLSLTHVVRTRANHYLNTCRVLMSDISLKIPNVATTAALRYNALVKTSPSSCPSSHGSTL